MLPHNIKKTENHSHLGECCRVCDTTEEHDCCVAEMIKSSSRGFNTMSAVLDKSTNTLTRISWGNLTPDDRMNKAMEFQNIVLTHADLSTNHVMVESEAIGRMEKMRGIH